MGQPQQTGFFVQNQPLPSGMSGVHKRVHLLINTQARFSVLLFQLKGSDIGGTNKN